MVVVAQKTYREGRARARSAQVRSAAVLSTMQPRSISQDNQGGHNRNARRLDIRRASSRPLKMECRRCGATVASILLFSDY